ncbi:phosphonatase-like hydrolase [Saccharopolyspora flava]|uniref:Phosphonatase-like hydrolase n=1 Tax=Saccharopolyspora flava TaxID=95161 RepID=A0A1I6UXL6_9PSEU|nr:phosphonatase-like hydrolase [Saccharopolyspora flava]SFT06179.1 phosphonatase-like hydrolase [Saccharopolyspora flava]
MIALAALDIAGTTIDEGGAVYRVLAEVVAEHGTPASDAELRRWMGADKRAALAALTGAPEATEALHDRFVTRLREVYAATPPVAFPGVPEALVALRDSGVRVALTTGFDRRITEAILSEVDWHVGDQLDAVVCADEVGAGRPAPDMIHRAMDLTGVDDPARVLAAGDTALDVQAGRAARAGRVVAVLTGAQTRAELEAHGPTLVLPGVADLPGVIGRG